MSEMITRMAAKMAENDGWGHWETIPRQSRNMWLTHARCAATALMVPTERMIVDGFEAMHGTWDSCKEASDDAKRCWHAMIMSVLNDTPSTNAKE